MTDRTPAQLRSDDAVELSDMLTRSGQCQVTLARATGVSSSVVGKWFSRFERHLPHAHDLRRFPKALARTILDWQAAPHGLTVVDRVEAGDAASHIGHLHRVLKESADVSIAYSGALADGLVTPPERDRIITELRESIAAERSLLAALEAEGARTYTKVRLVGEGVA